MYIEANDLDNINQSTLNAGQQKQHSSKHRLLFIITFQKTTLLVWYFWISATFDMINRGLLKRLSNNFEWFQSYLTDCSQSVKLENSVPDHIPLIYDVPQGSVLGPILFFLYSTPLASVKNKYHKYQSSCLICWWYSGLYTSNTQKCYKKLNYG